MADVCFIDCETTGLEDRHSIWEVGLITPDGREHVWQFLIDEVAADPFALDIGKWWDRRWPTAFQSAQALDAIDETGQFAITPGRDWCRRFRDLVGTSLWAGCVPSFDEERLRRLLLANGVRPRWNYQLIDVKTLAVGWFAGTNDLAHVGPPPWKSDDLSAALGIEADERARHTALGDARFAKKMFEAVMGA